MPSRIHGVPGRAAILAACFAAGGLFGFGMASIPAPEDVSVFWIGNWCAPWLVLAFVAGYTQSSWRSAALAGVLTNVGCVVGFYARFLTLDPLELGLPAESSVVETAATSLGRWLVFIAPWLIAAVAGGGLYGALGRWLGRGKRVAAGFAIALPFLAEPVLWPLRNGYYKGPWFIWAIELAIGIGIVLGVLRGSRRQSGATAGG